MVIQLLFSPPVILDLIHSLTPWKINYEHLNIIINKSKSPLLSTCLSGFHNPKDHCLHRISWDWPCKELCSKAVVLPSSLSWRIGSSFSPSNAFLKGAGTWGATEAYGRSGALESLVRPSFRADMNSEDITQGHQHSFSEESLSSHGFLSSELADKIEWFCLWVIGFYFEGCLEEQLNLKKSWINLRKWE